MRFLRKVSILTVLIVGSGMCQQFYRSEGLDLFNRGQHHAAIDSLLKWADVYTAERGIAYYYVGESYYNLGLNEALSSKAISYFRESSRYFDRARRQTDLVSLYPARVVEAQYKKAWCYYRLAELESDPLSFLERAYRGFSDVSSSSNDTLSVFALYMAGESRSRMAVWKRVLSLLSVDESRAVELVKETIRNLGDAERDFRRVADSKIASHHLRSCARVRYQDVLFERGKLYQNMSQEVFSKVDDPSKQRTASETAINTFLRVDYGSVLYSMDRLSKVSFKPVVTYSDAVKYLNLYLLTGQDQHKQLLNTVLDSLQWAGLREEKLFLRANRDHKSTIEDETFFRLSDPRISFYAKAAQNFPEAWYWLGWVQFIANAEESESQFDRFLQETENFSSDQRLAVLREDARYRTFLLRFDQNAANREVLNDLKGEIEAFQPRVPFIRNQAELLLQLVRVGLGESIWGRILRAPTTTDRLRDAFVLIKNMLVRATRVTGKERVPYLNYLEKLFQITEDRRSQETTFYRGLSLFLKAEIQETAERKRRLYLSAADMLKSSEGDYLHEGMYVQARSYFASAKHESSPDRINRVYQRARPLFIELINKSRSFRSVYYLGEIFRIQRNDLAARKCYEVVMKKTEGREGGTFWYNNALAGIQSCGSSGDTTLLRGIRIDEVVFPERLLMVDGEGISLERFADPDYVRKQYWEESIDLLMKFGLSKRMLYPSVFRLSASRFNRRAFRIVTAGIHERMGTITSGLQLQIVFPEGIPREVMVSLDGVPLEGDSQGFYQKMPIRLNQLVGIRVESEFCYPFVEKHRFVQPGVERMVVSLQRKVDFVSKGFGVETGVNVVHLPGRLDGNVILRSGDPHLLPATFLYKDFQSDIGYRDFVYSEVHEGYLVVHSEKENLLLYRNDPMVSKEGELPLVFSGEEEKVKSPEGIAVDSRGNVYVVDWGNHRVSVFRRDGSYVRSFGSLGKNLPADVGKPVRFVFPTRISVVEDVEGVFVHGQRVYRSPQIFVADRNGVHYMDVNGIYWDTLVPSGMKKGSLYGLTVRGYGSSVRLYVMNRKTSQIERFVARPAKVE